MKSQNEIMITINTLQTIQTQALLEKNKERVAEVSTAIQSLEWVLDIQNNPVNP